MITLTTVLDLLGDSEVSQLYLGDVDPRIPSSEYPKIVRAVNLALTTIFTRFALRTQQVTIQQSDSITDYSLSSDRAQSNTESTLIPKYIADSANMPFEPDILSIMAAYDEKGRQIPINDGNSPVGAQSVCILGTNTIQIPYPVAANAIFLICQMDHPRIDPTITDATTATIDMHPSLLEALTSFVAHRLFASRSDENAVALSANYLSKYERIAAEFELRNPARLYDQDTNVKLDIAGWA